MSKNIMIKTISAASIYDVTLGNRKYYDMKCAVLCDSLFSRFMKNHGLKIEKDSTRDIICLSFNYGSADYEKEIAKIREEIGSNTDEYIKLFKEQKWTGKTIADKVHKIKNVPNKKEITEKNKNILIKNLRRLNKIVNSQYDGLSADKLRNKFYNDGCDITYKYKKKQTDGTIKDIVETTHYKMLYRSSSKAKLGEVMFIKDSLYNIAIDWLTMGLNAKMPYHDAKIVELSAYAPLTTSTIVGTIKILPKNILILKDITTFCDRDSLTVRCKDVQVERKIEDIEKSEESKQAANLVGKKRYKKVYNTVYDTVKQTYVDRDENEREPIKSVLFDGQSIIDESIFPRKKHKGFILLRIHFFKSCAFRGSIQKFFKDWCKENGKDYNTYQVQDMFGNWLYLKDIKVITTDNSIKWKKFTNLFDNDKLATYQYWCSRIEEDGYKFGIVKSGHDSKWGEVQRSSYQMNNSLPMLTEEQIDSVTKYTIDFCNGLKDDEKFIQYLKDSVKNQPDCDYKGYKMIIALYEHNEFFKTTKFYRTFKTKEINELKTKRFMLGKLLNYGDNLTIVGNPYGMLMYAVGKDPTKDPTFQCEDDCIQCYTEKYQDSEYIAGFRSPHNAPHNVGYFHNVHSDKMGRYFPNLSKHVIAINMNGTDSQARMSGHDMDSDGILTTNQETYVDCAKLCYSKYKTIQNGIKEQDTLSYTNTMDSYAKMDNKLAESRYDIGTSSNIAQLALSYYWTTYDEEYEDIMIICSVLAQVAIDGCKRSFEIAVSDEIKRLQRLNCMKRGLPKWYSKLKISKVTMKDEEKKRKSYEKGSKKKEYVSSKDALENRIDKSVICPMNLIYDKINKRITKPSNPDDKTIEFVSIVKEATKEEKESEDRHKRENFNKIVKEYDDITESITFDEDHKEEYYTLVVELFTRMISKLKIGLIQRPGMIFLIKNVYNERYSSIRKRLLIALYSYNSSMFMSCFYNTEEFRDKNTSKLSQKQDGEL